jgi:hypothetical protein
MSAQPVLDSPLISWPGNEALPRFSIRSDAGILMAVGVMAGVEALPRRGLEVGGLLLGSAHDGEIVAAAVEEIKSFYPDGPSYRVPEPDLAAALASPKADGYEAVGFYRSRTDGKLDLDAQDHLFLRLFPRDRPTAILLVRQTKQIPAEVRLGFRIDDTIAWSETTLPLMPWLTGTVEPVSPDRAPVTKPPVSAREEVSHPDDLFVVMDDQRTVIEPLILMRVPEPAPEAERPQAANTQKFYPHIVAERLRLEPKRVRRAVLAGAALIAGLFIVMLALRDSAVVDKSRSVTTADVPAMHVNRTPGKTDVTPVETAGASPVTVPRPVSGLPQTPPAKPSYQAPPQEAEPVTERARVRAFRSPPQHIAGRTSISLPEPPPAFSQTPATMTGLPLLNQTISAAAPPAPAVVPVAAPVQFVPPVISRQSSPVVVPPDLRRMIQHEVVLSLRVSVDDAGRVTSVTPVNRLDRTEQALVRSYAAAIQTWQFDPAKRNGVPARGETILTFRVTPGMENR